MKGRTHALLGASLFFAPGVFGVSGSASGWSPGQILDRIELIDDHSQIGEGMGGYREDWYYYDREGEI